jgi:hypothetical protein
MSVCTFPGVPKYTAKSAAPLVKYEEKNTESLFSILVWPVVEKMLGEIMATPTPIAPFITPIGSVEVPLGSREINSGAAAPGFCL